MRRRRGSAHLVNRVVGYDRKTGEHVLEGEGGAKNRVRLHERRYFVLGHKVPMRYLLIWDAAAFTVAADFVVREIIWGALLNGDTVLFNTTK